MQDEAEEEVGDVRENQVEIMHRMNIHEVFYGRYAIWNQDNDGINGHYDCYICLRRYNDGDEFM